MMISLGEMFPCVLDHVILLHFSKHPYPFWSTAASEGGLNFLLSNIFCLTLLAAPCPPRACYLHPRAKLSQSHVLLGPRHHPKNHGAVALAEQDLLY